MVMELKKFLASNMAEAIIKVKNELGSDAMIIQTRRVRKGGFLGIGSKLYVEVTAFKEEDDKSNHGKRVYQKAHDYEDANELKSELHGIKSTLEIVNKKLSSTQINANFPEPFGSVYIKLIENGMKSNEASSIVEDISQEMSSMEARDKEKISSALRKRFENMIKTERIKFVPPGKIIFVGPTGVGKTTTLAKIAAMIKIKEKQPLSIVTLDTYRIAAAQQLKTYADIMHIPFKVVYTPEEGGEISSKIPDEILLVDTAGRSQKNELKITEITSYIQNIDPDTVFLVVDATKKRDNLEDVVKRFSVVNPTHFILTKLDETTSLLGVIKALSDFNIPLSFITNGQNVPDDIMYADEVDIPSLMVKEVLE